MTHPLDTIYLDARAEKKRIRATLWSVFPESIKRIAGHVGLLPPSDPRQISRIIERSIAFYAMNGLISLERQKCTIEWKNLSPEAQISVLEALEKSESGMTRILRLIVTNIPQSSSVG